MLYQPSTIVNSYLSIFVGLALWVWMGRNRLRLSPVKTGGLWIWGALQIWGLECTLQLKSRVCKASFGLSVTSIPGTGSPSGYQTCPSHLLLRLLYCVLHGVGLDDYSEVATDPECNSTGNVGMSWNVHVSLQFLQLHLLPVSFCVLFKLLIITYKFLHDTWAVMNDIPQRCA